MTGYERLRSTATSMIVQHVNAQFWSDLRALAVIAYADVFADVAADRNVLADQKLDDLLQRRHFRMEKLIVDLAVRHGLSHTLNVIVQNNRRHAYIFNGDDAVLRASDWRNAPSGQVSRAARKFDGPAAPRLG